jgi:lauroyl/myristoyl acyltransferase
MSSTQSGELTRALEAARRPILAPPLPSADLIVRLKTAPSIRRLIPTRLVVDRAEKRGRRLWELSPELRAQALAAAEAIVAGTAREGELEAIARQRLIESEIERVMLWQPWPLPKLEAETAARIELAIGTGRGVVLSLCHLGLIYYGSAVGVPFGRSMYVVVGTWLCEPPTEGYWGRRKARRLQGLRRYDARMIPVSGSFPVVAQLLRDGEAVFINFDVPGSHETRFLGKPVMLRSGTAKLAFHTDALVMPFRMRRERHRLWIDTQDPLDPRDFSGVGALHDALAAVHERWILEHPEMLEDPRRDGSWEDATAEGWRRRQEA